MHRVELLEGGHEEVGDRESRTSAVVRDVSDEVADTLKDRAAAEGKSLSAYVAGELSKMAARPTNVEIVAKLRNRDRSSGPTMDEIVTEVQAGRR